MYVHSRGPIEDEVALRDSVVPRLDAVVARPCRRSSSDRDRVLVVNEVIAALLAVDVVQLATYGLIPP